jgi:hypothetical protein
MTNCKWCGGRIKSGALKVLLDWRLGLYDHLDCNRMRGETYPESKERGNSKLTDFENKGDEK